MSSTLDQHCMIIIQMFCVWWEETTKLRCHIKWSSKKQPSVQRRKQHSWKHLANARNLGPVLIQHWTDVINRERRDVAGQEYVMNKYPTITGRWHNAGLMLAHRLRRWPSIMRTSVWLLTFGGYSVKITNVKKYSDLGDFNVVMDHLTC